MSGGQGLYEERKPERDPYDDPKPGDVFGMSGHALVVVNLPPGKVAYTLVTISDGFCGSSFNAIDEGNWAANRDALTYIGRVK